MFELTQSFVNRRLEYKNNLIEKWQSWTSKAFSKNELSP